MGNDTIEYKNVVQNNAYYLSSLLKSMNCGVNKAIRHNTVVDRYMLEKLEKFANVFDMTLVKR